MFDVIVVGFKLEGAAVSKEEVLGAFACRFHTIFIPFSCCFMLFLC